MSLNNIIPVKTYISYNYNLSMAMNLQSQDKIYNFLVSGYVEKLSDMNFPIQYDLVSDKMRFHLSVWKALLELDGINFWDTVDIQPTKESNLLFFKTKKYRSKFITWKAKYSNFFENKDFSEVFLPSIPSGDLKGSFVKYPSILDDFGTKIIFQADHILSILPVWVWIVHNCKKPVYKCSGGWIFTNKTEAAKFLLFNQTT